MPLREIWDGISLNYQGGTGGTVRRFVYTGLSAPPTNPSDNLALPLVSVGLPAYASPHPVINDMYASGLATSPFINKSGSTSKSDIVIDITYSVPTASQPLGGVYVEGSSSNGQIIKNRWETGPQAGQPILIGYKLNPNGNGIDPTYVFPSQIDPSVAAANDPTVTGIQPYDSVSFPIDSPNVIISMTRQENSAVPGLQYRKAVSTNDWQGFDAGTVYVREVHFVRIFGAGFIPNHFVMTYVFEVAPDPTFWQHVEIYKSTVFQKPAIVNLLDKTNNGYTFVAPIEMDLNGLNFPNNLLSS